MGRFTRSEIDHVLKLTYTPEIPSVEAMSSPPPAPSYLALLRSSSFFAHSRRNICCLDTLVEVISSSSRQALSAREARERLRMLADVVPEWCSIIAPPGPRKIGGGRDGGVDDGMVGLPT